MSETKSVRKIDIFQKKSSSLAILKPVLTKQFGTSMQENVEEYQNVNLNMNQLIFDEKLQKKLAEMSNINSANSIRTPMQDTKLILKGREILKNGHKSFYNKNDSRDHTLVFNDQLLRSTEHLKIHTLNRPSHEQSQHKLSHIISHQQLRSRTNRTQTQGLQYRNKPHLTTINKDMTQFITNHDHAEDSIKKLQDHSQQILTNSTETMEPKNLYGILPKSTSFYGTKVRVKKRDKSSPSTKDSKSNHYYSQQQLEYEKINPQGKQYSQEKLLILFRRSHNECQQLKKVLEMTENDLERKKNEYKSMILENQRLKFENQDLKKQILILKNQSQENQVFSTTQIKTQNEPIQQEEIDLTQKVLDLKKESRHQVSTIKMYREMLNQNIQNSITASNYCESKQEPIIETKQSSGGKNINFHDDLLIDDDLSLNLKRSQSKVNASEVFKLFNSSQDQPPLSQRSSSTKKTGKSSKIDAQRMEKLYQLLQATGKADGLIETFQSILQSLTGIINCQSGCIFIFGEIFSENEKKVLNVQKTIVDSHFIDVITQDGLEMQSPFFKDLKDAKNQLYTTKYISHPIIDSKGLLIGTVQVESTYHLKKITTDEAQEVYLHNKSSKQEYVLIKGQLKQKVHQGFSFFDEKVIGILTQVVRLKLESQIAQKEKQRMQREVVQTIQLAGLISTQRSQSDLVKNIKSSLPDFFGFEGAGIMFRDVKNGFLFTVNELSKDETELSLRDQFREQAKQCSERTGDELPKNIAQLEQMHVNRFINQFRETRKITYPNNRGVTGIAFHKKNVIVQNFMANEKDFESDIDNQTDIKNVRNYIIGPVFAHNNSFIDDKSSVEFDRQMPIGIIQLINKKNFGKISEYDIQKFEAMQTLIGLSIDQTIENHSTINIRIGVQQRLNNVDQLLTNQINVQNNYDDQCQGETLNVLRARKDIRRMIKDHEASSQQINQYLY